MTGLNWAGYDRWRAPRPAMPAEMEIRDEMQSIAVESRHALPIYPNLSGQIVPTAINQLWVGDITYIRLPTEFVYLAVVLDAFSRRVIGWALGRTLEAELALVALGMALTERQPHAGLVHHSIRYASQQ